MLQPCPDNYVVPAVLLIGSEDPEGCGLQVPCLGVSAGGPSLLSEDKEQLLAADFR